MLVLPRYGQQFIADRLDRLGFGHAAEPVGFALILGDPLRDRRNRVCIATPNGTSMILLAGRGLCSRRHDGEGVNGRIEGGDHLGMRP